MVQIGIEKINKKFLLDEKIVLKIFDKRVVIGFRSTN